MDQYEWVRTAIEFTRKAFDRSPGRPVIRGGPSGRGSGADRIAGAIRSGVRCGDADYAAMT